MKYLLLISTCFLFSFTVHAQLFTVPELVKQNFNKQYPEAKDLKWSDGLDNHTVRFTWAIKS